MAFIPGGGLRFAVPDVHNIKTDGWSNAVGGIAFGPAAEVYRVVAINETVTSFTTFAAGIGAHLETATGAFSQTATYGNLMPFIVGVSNSATAIWAGILAQAASTNQLAWLQVCGPITATLSNSGEASAQNTQFVLTNSTAFITVGTAAQAQAVSGMFAYNGGGHTSAQSTARLHMLGAPGIGVWNGKIAFSA